MALNGKKCASASAEHLEEKGMTRVIVNTEEAPKPAGYSQAVKAGGLVFVAGQGPFDATTGEVVGTTIQEQTAQCLNNIAAILHAAGSSLEHAVSATFILAEESDFAAMNEEWGKWFPKDPPARQGAKLPIRPKGMKISIALIAEA
jgi:2-iminobutanoate/2-iminopropanoate deaminase